MHIVGARLNASEHAKNDSNRFNYIVRVRASHIGFEVIIHLDDGKNWCSTLKRLLERAAWGQSS